MSGVLGEFDSASPAPKSFCSRISMAHYERQSAVTTEAALTELLDYLDYNPTSFYDVISKREHEAQDESSLFAYLKTKMVAWIYGQQDKGINLLEAQKKLNKFKEDIIKSYNYDQESKCSSRRFSRRVAERKWRIVNQKQTGKQEAFIMKKKIVSERKYLLEHTSDRNEVPAHFGKERKFDEQTELISNVKEIITLPESNLLTPVTVCETKQLLQVPPPPPPPPLLQQVVLPPPLRTVTQSAGLQDLFKNDKMPRVQSKRSNKENHLDIDQICNQKKKLRRLSQSKKRGKLCKSKSSFTKLLDSIKNPASRVLKSITQNSDPNVTPSQTHKERKAAENNMEPYSIFNQKLILKFQHTYSPAADSPASDREYAHFTP